MGQWEGYRVFHAVKISWRVHGRSLAALFAVLVAFVLHGAHISNEIQVAWLVGVTVLYWATGIMPGWWAGLSLITVGGLLNLAPSAVVLAGMTSSATWMVLAGIILGAAIEQTGLGRRLASVISPWLQGSFLRAVWGSLLLGVMMMFIMPSAMSRVLLLLPLLVALADELGYVAGRRGRTAIIMGGVLGTYLPASAVLPANIPNNVLAGATESLLGHGPQYGTYLLLHFPILGVLKIILLGIVLYVAYYDGAPPERVSPLADQDQPSSSGQQKLAGLLSITVLLWCTESIHGLPTAWVGMLAAMVCLCPKTGFLPPKPLSTLDLAPAFYVAGIVSMGALAYHSGFAQDVAQYVLRALPLRPEAPTSTFMALSALSTLMGWLVTLPGVPAVLTPMTHTLAQAAGWSDSATYMTQVVGFSTVWLPYQAPPLVMAIQSGHLRRGDVARMCLVTAMLSVLALWPLDAVWWQWLGWIK